MTMKKSFVIICLILTVLSGNAQSQNRKPAAAKPRTTSTAAKPNVAKATPKKKSITGLCPNDNHPHAIDLGLPTGTKWACCNVGADIPEECGGYFAEGEVKTKRYYGLENYKFKDGTTNMESGWYDKNHFDIRRTGYDAARVNMGEKWYMPSLSLYEELLNNCTSEWAEFNGVSGKVLTGPNGNSIFFPAAGFYIGNSLNSKNGGGNYWPGTAHNQCCIFLGYYTVIRFSESGDNIDLHDSRNRWLGQSVRAVLDE